MIKTQNELKQKISKYNSNEKLLENKSYIKIFNKNTQNISKDKELLKNTIDFFKKNKEICYSKINYIDYQINNLQFCQDKMTGKLKEKIDNNINKIKLNKSMSCNNIFDKKLKNLQKEHHHRILVMRKDLKISNKKKLKQLNNLIKEKEDQKIKLLKEIRNKEREDIKKRNHKNMENAIELRKYVNEKPKIEQYLYEKILNNYIEREANLINKENSERKKYMSSIYNQEYSDKEQNNLE